MENTNIINFNDFFKADFSKLPEFNKEDFKEFISEDRKVKEIPENKIVESILEEEIVEPIIENDNYYSVFKDKVEDFKFEIYLEGDAKLENTEARLILEAEEWTLMFVGEIDRKGVCTIPMKKLGILEEGAIGKIKVEVITDNTIFVPWEDEFKVKLSKKISIKVNENRNIRKVEPPKAGVKINVRH